MDLISRTMLLGAGGGEEEAPYWLATLGGSGDDRGRGIAIDSSGNVYVTGWTDSQGPGATSVLLTKYNTKGVIQWQRFLGGTNFDTGRGIAVDADDNVYVVGIVQSQGAGGFDLLIAKYNTSGTIQWQRSLGGASTDEGYGIAVDADGNVYVSGYTSSAGGAGSVDLFLAKYNTSGTIQWQRSLGGANIDTGYGIAVDASGNAYVTGSRDVGGTGVLIAKYNTSGTIQWQRSLDGINDDVGYGIAVDSSGDVYITGYRNGNELLIAKYNTSGTIQWQRSLSGANADRGYGIAVDSSGNVYVTGYTASQGAGSFDFLIAKYNTSGTIQWQRSLGGASTDEGYGIAVDSSGNVYVTGQTQSQGAGNNDVLIAKLPDDGSLTGTYGNLVYAATTLTSATSNLTSATSTLTSATRTLTDAARTLTDAPTTLTSTTTIIPVAYWIATLGGSGGELGYGIAYDGDGNVYVVGQTASQGAGGDDVLLAKYDAAGVIQWQRSLGGTGLDQGYGIAVDASGDVYVTGYTASQGAGGDDLLLAKYNTNGAIQWQRSLGGGLSDRGFGIAVDESGNVYVTGRTNSQGAGNDDALIAKYNTSGTIQWQRSLGGTGFETARGIAVDASGNVYVTGWTGSQGAGDNDVLIAKLPGNGGLTGTYGSLVYAATTLTAATRTLTSATRTLTDAARTLTDAPTTLTDAATTLTSSETIIQAGA